MIWFLKVFGSIPRTKDIQGNTKERKHKEKSIIKTFNFHFRESVVTLLINRKSYLGLWVNQQN